MTNQKHIADAFARKAAALTRRPSAGQVTGVTKIRLLDGLACEITERDWRFVADQPRSMGGEGRGPDPGFFGRAALGICAAQGYAYWLANLNVLFRAIEVRIETDSDSRGIFNVAKDIPPGYRQIRCIVEIDSDADPPMIIKALDEADRHSPWLYNFVTGLNVTREVKFR